MTKEEIRAKMHELASQYAEILDTEKNMFFGPAVNQAYLLESEKAIHPRILIDNYVAESVMDNIRKVKYNIINNPAYYFEAFPEQKEFIEQNLLPKMPVTGDGIIERDLDDKYIFNYLHPIEYNLPFPLSNNDFLYDLLEFCNAQRIKYKSYRVLDKYFYLERYVQRKIERINGHSDEPLEQLDETQIKH